MRALILMLLPLIVLTMVPVLAQNGQSVPDQLLLQPYQKDIYGPGVNSNVKNITRQTRTPQVVPKIPDPPINMGPDIFGPGIGSGQYRKPLSDQLRLDE